MRKNIRLKRYEDEGKTLLSMLADIQKSAACIYIDGRSGRGKWHKRITGVFGAHELVQ